MLADALRRFLVELPEIPVPYPDAWRYAFIILGLFVVGLELAIFVEARYVGIRGSRSRIQVRLVAAGTGTIVLLLVYSLYLRIGMGGISVLIVPGMAAELSLATGLFMRFKTMREETNQPFSRRAQDVEHH